MKLIKRQTTWHCDPRGLEDSSKVPLLTGGRSWVMPNLRLLQDFPKKGSTRRSWHGVECG